MMVTIQKVILDQGTDDKSRRHPRWTRQETLLLIQAKEITENSPHKGRKISSIALVGSENNNTEPKWVSISSYCKQQGVDRGPAQCRKRWSNLIGDFKKVKNWESKLTDKADSFWSMRNDVRKEKKLPVTFDVEVFKVLEAREMSSGSGTYAAASPMPLQAFAASGISDDVNDYADSDEERMGDEEEEEQDADDTVSDILGDVQKDNKTSHNATESPVKDSSNAEPSSEQQHDQAFQNQKRCSSQVGCHNGKLCVMRAELSANSYSAEPSNILQQDKMQVCGTFRESSWPGISYWESQERRKRQRPSANGHQTNDREAHIARVVEKNNKMFNTQLDALNNNCQLDREQRKETNDMLVAALGRLTDSLAKIAEKL